MKPIVGIIAGIDNDLTLGMFGAYGKAIEKSGGVPLVLPYVEGDDAIDTFVNICDGFFFTGGVDISPDRYGEDKQEFCGTIQIYRDELEFRVLERIIKEDKPILAICRGCQLINVALGGTLYQDLPTEYKSSINHRQTEPKHSPSHNVKILHGTPLFELIKKETMVANSFHHQAIKRLGAGLLPMAYADDGIIEAIYYNGEKYIRAYQWHPERLYESNAHNKLLFDDFINNCR